MTIYFACAHCGKRHKAHDKMADKIASCVQCGEDLAIPRKSTISEPQSLNRTLKHETVVVTETPEQLPIIRKRIAPSWGSVKKVMLLISSFFWVLAIPFLPLVAIVSRYSGPSLLWLWGNLCLIVFVFAVFRPLSKRWPRYKNSILIGSIVAGFSLAWVNQVTATYYDEHDGEFAHYTITRRRDRTPTFEQSYSRDPLLIFSGPLVPSGKRHGEWKMYDGKGTDRIWYWYGEEVTEGEWHLRNRD